MKLLNGISNAVAMLIIVALMFIILRNRATRNLNLGGLYLSGQLPSSGDIINHLYVCFPLLVVRTAVFGNRNDVFTSSGFFLQSRSFASINCEANK